MPLASLLICLLPVKVSLDFLQPLLLKNLLDLSSHGTQLFVLLYLVRIKLAIPGKLLKYPKLIIFLCCKVHEGSLFDLQVSASGLILTKGELIRKSSSCLLALAGAITSIQLTTAGSICATNCGIAQLVEDLLRTLDHPTKLIL